MSDEQTNTEEHIQQLEAAKLSGVLPASVADASIAALREKLATYTATLTGDSGIGQGPGAIGLGSYAIYVGDNFQGNIYQGENPAKDEKRLEIYCEWVRRTSSSLPLRGVDVGASDPTGEQKPIGLANVYIDLDSTVQVYEKQKKAGEKKDTDPSKENIFDQFRKGETVSRQLAVLECVIDNPKLVLLGDPGGGKSTFVNFLAHCLSAHNLEPNKNWLAHLPGWPQDEAAALPIVVILRDFARHFAEKLPARAEPEHLLQFIAARLTAQNLSFALPLLEAALDSGQAFVLLDGLDEVPTQAQRLFVRDAVHAFLTRHSKTVFWSPVGYFRINRLKRANPTCA